MENEILYITLPNYAAHEVVYLSQAITSGFFSLKENPKYINRLVAPNLEPIVSISGFRTLPDYSFNSIPEDYAALILVGGFGWSMPVSEEVVPLIQNAITCGRIIGAICNAVSFMAKHGFLNTIKHTGNGREQLMLWGGESYTNADAYINTPAVKDHNIVTANGFATLEFAKEILLLLKDDTPEHIEMFYEFNKYGFQKLSS